MKPFLLFALTFVPSVTSVLIAPNFKRNGHSQNKYQRRTVTGGSAVFSDVSQKPLHRGNEGDGEKLFSVREQTEAVCRAGSRQWTGWIHVSDEKSLFFCKP